jgi:hypothetical protein
VGGYQISLRLLQALIYPLSLPRRLHLDQQFCNLLVLTIPEQVLKRAYGVMNFNHKMYAMCACRNFNVIGYSGIYGVYSTQTETKVAKHRVTDIFYLKGF